MQIGKRLIDYIFGKKAKHSLSRTLRTMIRDTCDPQYHEILIEITSEHHRFG